MALSPELTPGDPCCGPSTVGTLSVQGHDERAPGRLPARQQTPQSGEFDRSAPNFHKGDCKLDFSD